MMSYIDQFWQLYTFLAVLEEITNARLCQIIDCKISTRFYSTKHGIFLCGMLLPKCDVTIKLTLPLLCHYKSELSVAQEISWPKNNSSSHHWLSSTALGRSSLAWLVMTEIIEWVLLLLCSSKCCRNNKVKLFQLKCKLQTCSRCLKPPVFDFTCLFVFFLPIIELVDSEQNVPEGLQHVKAKVLHKQKTEPKTRDVCIVRCQRASWARVWFSVWTSMQQSSQKKQTSACSKIDRVQTSLLRNLTW